MKDVHSGLSGKKSPPFSFFKLYGFRKLECVFKNHKILGLEAQSPLCKYFKTHLPMWVASAWTAEAAVVEIWLHSWEEQ